MILASDFYTNKDSTICIVLCKEDRTKEMQAFIGTCVGGNQKEDEVYVSEWGAKFPINAAKAMFPTHFKENKSSRK